jgi:signal transduction histidine kinase
MRRLIRAVNLQNPEYTDKIVSEILKIQSEVENISGLARVLSSFANEVFEHGDVMERTKTWTDQKSSVLLGKAEPMTLDCIQFLNLSKAMDLIFVPVIRYNPNLEFIYIINNRGITRGYPTKDFSILPPDFDATMQPFFCIANEQHNPERKERWTEPYLCPLTKIWLATCVGPVYQDDTFKGVVGIDVNLGRVIEGLARVFAVIPGGYTFLVSPQGNLIISSDAGMNSLTKDTIVLLEHEMKTNCESQLLTGNILSGEVVLSSGRACLFYHHFSSNDWDLFCVLPKTNKDSALRVSVRSEHDASLMHNISGERSYYPLISFVSSFNESLKQVEKLIEGIAMIGRGMLNHRITIERKDELGLLAVSINKMAKELKKRKEELEGAYKKISQMDRLAALGRLTAGIAHEINNPLGIIYNYIQILTHDASLPQQTREDVQIIEEEIHRVNEIIKGLLNFSGQTMVKKCPIQINEVLQKTINFVKLHLKSQKIELVEQYDDRCPWMLGDATSLQQAFLNIALNSIEAVGKEGRIGIRSRYRTSKMQNAKKNTIEVSITDSGRGMEKKLLDKIFDPFFSLKPQGHGTGIGLSISYGIIREHNGDIYVRSVLGKGTSVTIVLPIFPQAPDEWNDKNIPSPMERKIKRDSRRVHGG